MALVALCGALTFPVTASAITSTWPIALRRATDVQSAADLKGVLIQWGDEQTFQVDYATWAISAGGDLGFQTFHGWDQSGKRIDYDSPTAPARVAMSVGELGAFRLGDPGLPEKQIRVQSATFATNGDGYLTFKSLQGYMQQSGAPVSANSSGYTCMLYQGECSVSISCMGNCTNAPICPCSSGGPNCLSWSNPSCSGSCPAGMECYTNSQGICGCNAIVYPPPGGGGAPADTTRPKKMQVVPDSGPN